jgi:adenosylcobinamide kinase/adenosylcobinamide-phosphate guanylyltransferase
VSRRLTLILGGARSGKSSLAEKMAAAAGGSVLFVATAEPGDEEMAGRIAAHRAARPAAWRTLEAPRDVGPAIRRVEAGHAVVVVDCITVLVANAVAPLGVGPATQPAAAAGREVDGLLDAYRESAAEWIVISNEVGLGIVPDTPLGRAYRDILGRANQRLAASADSVLFLVAGIPVKVK